jgi:hypothetical protein
MKPALFLFALLIGYNTYSQSNKINDKLILPKKEFRKEITLNGLWNFVSNKTNEKVLIRVPGCYTNLWDGKWGKPYWDAFGYPREWDDKGALYERQIVIPDSLKNLNLRLHLNGCLQNYTVIFDDRPLETVHDGYTPRNFDLGRNIPSGSHSLKIRVEDEPTRLNGGESQKSRGIWDDVSLLTLPDVFVEEDTYIKTSFKNKTFECDYTIKNTTETAQTVLIKYFITDSNNKIVKTIDGGEQIINARQTGKIQISTSWNDPHLWFPHDPYLYNLNTVLYSNAGKPVDWHRERFGFREITWVGPVLYLNGRELYLRGHGEHYLGDLQASREYFTTWFLELKKLGVNFMRLHIYPRHKVLYEVADEVGFMLEAEPAFHFQVPKDEEFARKHLGDMMKGLINHPSVIVWSVSNELRWRGGGEKKWLVDYARSVDNTRPVFSSDFSEYSVFGDVLGHHYNTETVFKEWEQFGPDKPMIWDECGEVWQANRPLGNGTAGFEVTAQDYATGLYRDGNDEIKTAMNLIREGQTFNSKLHRVNAVVPWDLGYVFFRWQPFNRYRGIEPAYKTLESPDVKPIQVLPCSSPLNIWDPSLPVYEPNPGYYLFAEDMKWVRFPYDSKNFSFFGGEKTVINTPLLIYEDLRLVDEIHCIIETPEGKILTQTIKKTSVSPGAMLRDVKWEFDIPAVTEAQPVKIVREFWYQGQAGYRDEREGRIFPKFASNLINLNNKKIGVVDSKGRLKQILKSAQIPYIPVTGKIKPKEFNILLVDGNNLPENVRQLTESGLCLIQFKDADDKLQKGSARLLVNGPGFKLLNSIEQKELTWWKGGNEYGGMEKPGGDVNSRILISGDKDGKTSALHELYIGKGCQWITSLRIIECIYNEPAAGWLLRNLIQAAAGYNPTQEQNRIGIFGASDFMTWAGQTGPKTEVLKTLSVKSLAGTDVLLLDARKKSLNDDEIKAISDFTDNGGKTFVYQINDLSLPGFKKIINQSLTLSKPFLGETANCVKAATCWTLRDSPKTGVEYYDDIVIPQPFEPNYDPFLAGLSNIDLNWSGKTMFEKGVKLDGISQVKISDNYRILISNWRNDWGIPPFGGEYINEGKDMRQALWYLNRDPVLVRIKHGQGEFIICQLSLIDGEAKGLSLMRHLLTNWDCSIGVPTSFPVKESVFDFTASSGQRQRLSEVETTIASLKTLPKIPDVFFDMGNGGENKLRRILLLVDNRTIPLAPEIIKKMTGFGNMSYSGVSIDSPGLLLSNFESALGGSKWDIIYFSVGYSGIKDMSETNLQKFDSDMQKIVTLLKNTNAKLMWGSQSPLPLVHIKDLDNSQINQLNIHARKIMDKNGVLVNDIYGFMMDKTPEYINQDKKELILINSDYHITFTPKIISSIVEALKFFGN